jgi:hypothetical protein
MRPWLALLLVVLVPSCLGDDDGDPSSYVAIDQAATAYKDAQCTYLARCGVFPDKATCLAAQLTSSPFRADPNLIAAIGAGRVYYQGSNVKQCFDALAARSCDRTSESARVTPAACRDFVRGTAMGGESCTIDAECVSGQCSTGSSEDSCVMGLCLGNTPPPTELRQIGEQCFSTLVCAPGSYCDSVTDTCTALKPAGATCQQDSECAYGSGCTGTTGTRTCGPLPAVGQSCSTDGICRDEGTYCDFNTGNCARLGLAGMQCSSSSQCSPYYPCNFSTSQCSKGPAVGQPCSGSSFERCFDANTFCDQSTSTCTALRANGMACNSDSECTSDNCELGSSGTGVCTAPTVCF